MPQGSKKYRAARHKQQQQHQASDSPDSQPNSPHPPDNDVGDGNNNNTDQFGEERDSPRTPATAQMESSVNDKEAAKDVAPEAEEVIASEVEEVVQCPPPTAEIGVSEEVSLELADPVVTLAVHSDSMNGDVSIEFAEPAVEATPAVQSDSVHKEVSVEFTEPAGEDSVNEQVSVEFAEPAVEASAMPIVHLDSVNEEVMQMVEDKAITLESVVDAFLKLFVRMHR